MGNHAILLNARADYGYTSGSRSILGPGVPGNTPAGTPAYLMISKSRIVVRTFSGAGQTGTTEDHYVNLV